jgi:hypothetical protein
MGGILIRRERAKQQEGGKAGRILGFERKQAAATKEKAAESD